MKITHTINRNMFNEYLPSKVALSLVREKDRVIRSEDDTWKDFHPPRLTEICVRVIASNFTKKQILAELPCTDRNLLLEILPTNLPLPLVLQHLSDGIYWKRMVNDHWKDRVNYVEDHGSNWKRMYMERYVQEQVEGFTPEGFDIDTVNEMCNMASDYVYKLDLRQLKMVQSGSTSDDGEEFNLPVECFDHIDLSPIITGLQNLTELHIQFGIRHIGSNYKKSLFELSDEDCRNIGKGVTSAKKLKVLRIHQSALDDDRVISLLSEMTKNYTLETLDFSNCLIGDGGATAIAKYLRGRKNILHINLCNNRIREVGMEALSYVLTQRNTSPIVSLNLRFNEFGSPGLNFLASALVRDNPKVEILNLSCCDLDIESGILLAEMIKRNGILRDLNLSNNHFDESVGRAFEAGMKVNKKITNLDLRMTNIPNENILEICRDLHYNRIRERKGEKGVERERQLLEQSPGDYESNEAEEEKTNVQAETEPRGEEREPREMVQDQLETVTEEQEND